MTTARRKDAFALAILTALITLLFIDVLVGYHALYLRDLAHYYYPAKHVLREIVLGGEFPYWNPLLAAGQPMAANPEHEVFYPLTWLILLPSYDLGFRLLLLVHLCIAGWTMYALLRSMSTSPAAAFFGALSFAIGGIVLSCFTLLPILFALAWLPLTCLFTRRFLQHRRPRDFVFAAGSLGLQVLVGEPTTIGQTGLLLGMYALALCIRERALRPLIRLVMISIAGFAVGAATLLPAIDHARDSVRAEGFTFEVVTTWSAPFARAAEMVFPNVLGHHAPDGGGDLYWGRRLHGERKTPFFLNIYPGLLLATMLIAGFVLRARGAGLTGAVLAVSWLLAVGHHTPLWRWMYDAGIARSVRFPEKFLLMGIFAATVFAARVLGRILDGDEAARRVAIRVGAGVAIVAGVAALIAITPMHAKIFIALWKPSPALLPQMLVRARSAWIVAALFATLLTLLLRNLPTVRRRTWLALATLFVLLDLGLILPEIAPRVPTEYFTEPPLLARQLPGDRHAWRLLHVIEWQAQDVAVRPFTTGQDLYWISRNSLRPMMPARWGIRTVMEADYDMTELLPTAQFVESAWWLAHAREDWPVIIGAMANARFFGKYDDPQQALARVNGNRRIVQPVRVLPLGDNPRYFFAERLVRIRDSRDFAEQLSRVRSTVGTAFVQRAPFSPARGIVRSVRETANTARIEVETAGTAFLVMSVTPHKYWSITVDGIQSEAVIANVGFQGVVIPTAGRHVVEMRYRNPLITVGAAISVVALLALAFVAITMRAL
ncbi:MAG TPA: hypothetical protein VGQ36_00565 [Thermoanaerobaculia bacterium]|nr:hypothetical protein [Thermoanaerobaculia bacterium]